MRRLRAVGDARRRLSSDEAAEPSAGDGPVPSAGALYPLELYVVALAVDGLEPGVYHYNPFRHRLESLGAFEPERLRAALVDRELADRAAALLVVTAVFWRSRFKYGARGYRFALLEAGHVVRTRSSRRPPSGWPRCRSAASTTGALDELVGADGLDEATALRARARGRR